VQRRVSASTQNQALSALLFLYREVLHLDVGPIGQVPRAQTLSDRVFNCGVLDSDLPLDVSAWTVVSGPCMAASVTGRSTYKEGRPLE
jgi:hypothetical protein